jgi:hypothetical protein
MVRELPKVWMGDKQYYKDDRLKEFRAVDNPHERINFEEVPHAYLGLICRLNYLFKGRC